MKSVSVPVCTVCYVYSVFVSTVCLYAQSVECCVCLCVYSTFWEGGGEQSVFVYNVSVCIVSLCLQCACGYSVFMCTACL